MTAEEIMTRDLVTVDETTTVGEALSVLTELDIRHLPVLRDGELSGMLSDRDFRSLGVSLITDLESLDRMRSRLSMSVTTLMSSDVLSVEPSTDVAEIIDLMLDEKIGAVPVVDTHAPLLLGIVSYVDILRATRETLR